MLDGADVWAEVGSLLAPVRTALEVTAVVAARDVRLVVQSVTGSTTSRPAPDVTVDEDDIPPSFRDAVHAVDAPRCAPEGTPAVVAGLVDALIHLLL